MLAQLLRLGRRGPPVSAPRPAPAAFRSAALTHIGRVRRVNEDRLLDCSEHGLWAVADGMGGHSAGDVAATIAVRALAALADTDAPIAPPMVRRALEQAHREIARRAPPAQLSGSTIAALVSDGHRFTVLWAGDSRVYRYREGRLAQLTHDHSLVQELVDAHAIAAEAARGHPQANVVTRALGVTDTIRLDTAEGAVLPGDRFLLCSDGISALVPEARIAAAMAAPLAETVTRLSSAALDAGGFDNLTVVVVERAA